MLGVLRAASRSHIPDYWLSLSNVPAAGWPQVRAHRSSRCGRVPGILVCDMAFSQLQAPYCLPFQSAAPVVISVSPRS